MTNDDFGKLRLFLGAYFHQDWSMEAAEPDEVVRLFISDVQNTDELTCVARQLERFSDDGSDTAIERRLFRDLGCYYMPSADGMGAAAWLRHVATLLKAAA